MLHWVQYSQMITCAIRLSYSAVSNVTLGAKQTQTHDTADMAASNLIDPTPFGDEPF